MNTPQLPVPSQYDDMQTWPSRVLFYDGECPMCSSSVKLLATLDFRRRMRFSPLSGLHAETLWQSGLLPAEATREESIVLFAREHGSSKSPSVVRFSSAVLESLRSLGFPMNWVAMMGSMVPTSWRDAIYRKVAKRRREFMQGAPLLSCNVPSWLRPYLLP